VIDEFTIVEDEIKGAILMSEEVQLEADQFVPIKLQYFENDNLAFVSLIYR
jgi:hypothetical protein